MSDETSKDRILNRLEQKAGDYEEMSRSCLQGCLFALQEQFSLGDVATFKASTALLALPLRGETCGAVMGGLMAIGLASGRERLDDWEGLVRAIGPAARFCRSFEKEFDSLMCRDIQKAIFGKSFNMADPAELEEFEKADGYKKCRVPPGRAARIAGELLMEVKEAC